MASLAVLAGVHPQISQLWPLAMCGFILTGFYVGAYLVISSIAARLATLNIVTFVAVRFTRTFFFAQVTPACCTSERALDCTNECQAPLWLSSVTLLSNLTSLDL
jgi:hypothetical protein